MSFVDDYASNGRIRVRSSDHERTLAHLAGLHVKSKENINQIQRRKSPLKRIKRFLKVIECHRVESFSLLESPSKMIIKSESKFNHID